MTELGTRLSWGGKAPGDGNRWTLQQPPRVPTGVVIHTKDTVDDVGTLHMVDIDLGQEDGIAPGDFLTAFEPVGRARRPHQSDYHYKFAGEVFYGTDLHYDNDGKEYPAKPVGQMIVVRTGSHTATAKIIYAVIEMHVGTIVEVD